MRCVSCVACWLLVARCLLSVVCYGAFVVRRLLLVVFGVLCLLDVGRCVLFVVCCVMLLSFVVSYSFVCCVLFVIVRLVYAVDYPCLLYGVCCLLLVAC